ncbi:MAG: sporulation protein YunB, partial [Clostridia bacterium]|nr:sporulation protein YunB [Clostridia bacterium]
VLTNSYQFNLLSNKIADEVINYFNNKLSQGVEVPIGVFTGIGLISGFGKKVKMPLITVSSVKCDIISSFTDAGINQTKHSIVINIIPEVFVVTRFSTKDLKDSISVLVYENIIVGKIPNTYLEGSIISTQKTLK